MRKVFEYAMQLEFYFNVSIHDPPTILGYRLVDATAGTDNSTRGHFTAAGSGVLLYHNFLVMTSFTSRFQLQVEV